MIDIGSRLELLVDDFLIDRVSGVSSRLHRPTPREIVLEHQEPWEGNASIYDTVFQDDGLYRLYYAGNQVDEETGEEPHPEFACYAESQDGIHWTKPRLELVAFNGSRDNNIIIEGIGTHCFTPFKDTNPDCEPDARYKGLGRGIGEQRLTLFAFKSPDAIHWSLMSDAPVITDGYFDSQNLAFWDDLRGEYRAYFRDFKEGIRDVKTGTSKDFLNWTPGAWLEYPGAPVEHLYTNQVIPYYRAPHIFLGFPSRYVHDRGVLTDFNRMLAEKQTRRTGRSYTDGLFMSSRDAHSFRRWDEAFIRPGPQGIGRWVYGDNFQNWGLVETASDISGAPNDLSIYVSEGYRRGRGSKLRRHTLRIDGFVSVQAPLSGGEMVTKPFTFQGHQLAINFSTSAAGGIKVEVQSQDGSPIEGYTAKDCDDIFGDEIERVISWSGNTDLSPLEGEPVRLRFLMKDADLYAFQFRPETGGD